MKDYAKHIRSFIDYCKYHKNLSNKTIASYNVDLKQYEEFTKELDRQTLWEYIEHLNRKYKPKTVKRKIATLKAFTHYLLIQDLIEINPFDKIEIIIKEPILLPKTIPLPVIRRLLLHLYSKIDLASTEYMKMSAIRNAAIVELLFVTGARIAEICTLSKENIDLIGRKIKFYGKNSKERIISIENASVIALLERYTKLFENEIADCNYFFVNKHRRRLSEQSVREMLKNSCTSCGISLHITPHMFRHSFATYLLEEDVDIRYIQQMLGHSSITTTQIYTHVTSSKQKEILRTKHPRNKMLI